MDEWKEASIDELFEVQNGYAFKSSDFVDECDGCLEVLKMGHIEKGGGLRKDPKKSFIPGSEKLVRWVLNKDDIVMAMTDMKDNVVILGVPARIDKGNHYVLNQRVARLKLKRKDIADIDFLYSYLKWREFILELQSKANSGVQVNLSTTAIKESVVLLPSLPKQKAIASVLSSLDDKIDLLHRQNKTLEAMAETLFRQWFVEEAQEDWETKTSELPIEIIDGDRGKNYPKNSELLDVGVSLFLSAKNVTTNGFNFNQCQFITAEKDALLRSGKLNRNDIVITTRGTVGNIAYYNDLIGHTDIRINSGMIIIRTVSSIVDPIFIFCLIRSNYFKCLIENQISGSAQPQLPIRDFKQIDVYYPPKEKIDKFLVFAKPCLNKKFYNDLQIEKLEKMRDMLLPKLMCGEARIIY